MNHRLTFLLASLLASGAIAAGCGGDDGDTGGSNTNAVEESVGGAPEAAAGGAAPATPAGQGELGGADNTGN
jgi:hypothetical protein